jgi:very-short-patch-repair endonuclease
MRRDPTAPERLPWQALRRAALHGLNPARDAWLLTRGMRVFRVWNNEVMGNLDGVLAALFAAACADRTGSTA